VLLRRNRQWWGVDAGLGPALDEIAFRIVPEAQERIDLLREAEVQVATGISASQADEVRNDPLLTALPAVDGESIAYERSVRGWETTRPVPLAAAWIALLSG